MSRFSDAYRPCLGQKLAAIAWRPITADTPGLVEDLRKPYFSYSGAAELHFAGAPAISLTWINTPGGACALGCDRDWSAHSLDTVHASYEDPWGALPGAILRGVEVFAEPDFGLVVALKHAFETSGSVVVLWVGVGLDEHVHEGDDLVVFVHVSPRNIATCVRVEVIE